MKPYDFFFKGACLWVVCLAMAGPVAAYDLVPQIDLSQTAFNNNATQGVAHIQQDGADNLAQIDQTVGTLDLNQNAHFAEIFQSGTGNKAYVLQGGNLNVASLSQTGSNNTVRTDQQGNGNRITASQAGNDSNLTVNQYGDLNNFVVTQPGNNESTLTAYGNSNTIELHQSHQSVRTTYNITITSDHMSYKVTQ
jgi:hypothetical protein